MASTTDEGGRTIRSVEIAFRIIDLLQEKGEAGVTELADEVGMGKSAVHNHLTTLRKHGYVIQTDDGYQIGLKFLEVRSVLAGGLPFGVTLHRKGHPNDSAKIAAPGVGTGRTVRVIFAHGGHADAVKGRLGQHPRHLFPGLTLALFRHPLDAGIEPSSQGAITTERTLEFVEELDGKIDEIVEKMNGMKIDDAAEIEN